MKANCWVCGKVAEKVNHEGNWVCNEHTTNSAKQQPFDIHEIAKELKKYISIEDLDQIVQTREKIKDLNLDNIASEVSKNVHGIRNAAERVSGQINVLADLIEEQKNNIIPKHINVIYKDREISVVGKHFKYPKLLNYIANRKDVWVNGPAGSGKTTAIKQAADELEMPFYAQQLSQLSLKSELTGYRDLMDKSGVMTPFWEAYKNGGVFFGSEFDNWAPSVVTSVNVALANGYYPFPTETIKRHPDFVMAVDGNTIGLGAENHYVTSRAVSGASRDRFRFLHWPIDEELEFLMVPKKYEFWVKFVQNCRKLAKENGEVILITPRATIQGAEDLEMGFEKGEVIDNVLLRSTECPSYLANAVERFVRANE